MNGGWGGWAKATPGSKDFSGFAGVLSCLSRRLWRGPFVLPVASTSHHPDWREALCGRGGAARSPGAKSPGGGAHSLPGAPEAETLGGGKACEATRPRGWDGKGQRRPALRRGWPQGDEDDRGGGAGGTLAYLLRSRPRVRREPADRLTSGYRETLSCFCCCRRRRRLLSRGTETPNFRRRRRRLARQMGVTWDLLGRACATLFFCPNPLR